MLLLTDEYADGGAVTSLAHGGIPGHRHLSVLVDWQTAQLGMAFTSPPSTLLSPSLSNLCRRLLIGFGFLWLCEHAQSIEEVQVAQRRQLARAVGDVQTHHHTLGHGRIGMRAA
jgi:hypothetical protein